MPIVYVSSSSARARGSAAASQVTNCVGYDYSCDSNCIAITDKNSLYMCGVLYLYGSETAVIFHGIHEIYLGLPLLCTGAIVICFEYGYNL